MTRESIRNICLTSDGKYLSMILGRQVAIVSLAEKNLVVSYETGGWELSSSIAFHPSNESLAFGDARGTIHVWNDFQSFFQQSQTKSSRNKNKNNSKNKNKNKDNNSNNNSNNIGDRVMGILEWLNQDVDNKNEKQKQENNKANDKQEKTHTTESVGSGGTGDSGSGVKHNIKKNKQSHRHGRIGKQSEYLIRQYHWHAHKVNTISFTTDGAYMISGGEEAVLVMTQLETNRHQFLPRLGGTIRDISVSPDEIKFSVCLDSNMVRIIDSVNNKIFRTIEGISLLHRLTPKFNGLLQRASIDPRYKNGNSIVIPSLPGCIQFYDLQNDVSRGNLQLVKYPIISRTQEKEPDRFIAQFMVLNRDGTRLVTVVKRQCESILGIYSNNKNNGTKKIDETENSVTLVTLQIFHFNVKNGHFILNTRIDSPHGTNPIRGVSFHPIKNRFFIFEGS